jgi:hypothetical protein
MHHRLAKPSNLDLPGLLGVERHAVWNIRKLANTAVLELGQQLRVGPTNLIYVVVIARWLKA